MVLIPFTHTGRRFVYINFSTLSFKLASLNLALSGRVKGAAGEEYTAACHNSEASVHKHN